MKSAEPAHQANDDKSLPLIISTGVSATHAGAVLEQEHKFDGNIEPNTLEFYAKVFPSTNQVRLTFHRELKALYMALKYSKFRIQGLTLFVRGKLSVVSTWKTFGRLSNTNFTAADSFSFSFMILI